jgi:hypothetical protein
MKSFICKKQKQTKYRRAGPSSLHEVISKKKPKLPKQSSLVASLLPPCRRTFPHPSGHEKFFNAENKNKKQKKIGEPVRFK